MAIINTGIGSAFLKFQFSDDDGEVISSFRINPSDIKVAMRCEEVSEYFNSKKTDLSGSMSARDMADFNDELESKICYVLGYDARNELFKAPLTATTILPSGDLFAVAIMDKIVEAVKPEIEKRRANMEKAAAKYTSKYDRV
jgi:hypothetical protein